jgi:hypothetical protein
VASSATPPPGDALQGNLTVQQQGDGPNPLSNSTFDSLIDLLKFVAATVDQVWADLAPQCDHVNAARLTHAWHVLLEAVSMLCPHCAGDMEHYGDGRQVTTHLRFCDGTEYAHGWHPDPAHAFNRPRSSAPSRRAMEHASGSL